MKHTDIGRFAPSPSGYMHMGNLLAMLLAWLDIRARGGRMIFRMEDLDPARSKREYIEALEADLRWLGLDWDEGYPDPAYSQSRRTAIYESAFGTLQDLGLVYPCFCTRSQRLAAASAPHPGEACSDPGCPCARLSRRETEALMLTRRPAWKLRAPDETVTVTDGHYGAFSQNLRREGGDFILRRSDGVFAYQLAVSADDMLMGVTRVVRGLDLLSSAPRQAWLIKTLGGTPPDYCHTPLLLAAAGEKLSKRLGSMSTQAFRQSLTPEALTGHLAFLCGLTPTDAPITPQELVPLFAWEKIAKEDILI